MMEDEKVFMTFLDIKDEKLNKMERTFVILGIKEFARVNITRIVTKTKLQGRKLNYDFSKWVIRLPMILFVLQQIIIILRK